MWREEEIADLLESLIDLRALCFIAVSSLAVYFQPLFAAVKLMPSRKIQEKA
jgi:hypothetical protein